MITQIFMCYSDYIEKGYIIFPERFHKKGAKKSLMDKRSKFRKSKAGGFLGLKETGQI
jgi:hypothetical protein